MLLLKILLQKEEKVDKCDQENQCSKIFFKNTSSKEE